MKLERRLMLGFVTLFLFVGISWTVFGQKPARPDRPATWEYKIVYDGNGDRMAEERIAPLGAQGWELVNAVKDGSTEITFFFKRSK